MKEKCKFYFNIKAKDGLLWPGLHPDLKQAVIIKRKNSVAEYQLQLANISISLTIQTMAPSPAEVKKPQKEQ